MLVIDQGTLLDSVEYNIEQTAVRVGDAVKELQEATRWVVFCVLIFSLCFVASRYQKNTGRRKCIFLLLLIIFGLVIALIFKPRRHTSSSQPPLASAIPVAGTDSSTHLRLRLRHTDSRRLPLLYPPSRPPDPDSHQGSDVWEHADRVAGHSY